MIFKNGTLINYFKKQITVKFVQFSYRPQILNITVFQNLSPFHNSDLIFCIFMIDFIMTFIFVCKTININKIQHENQR